MRLTYFVGGLMLFLYSGSRLSLEAQTQLESIVFGPLKKIGIVIGPLDAQEINIDNLIAGPQGWFFGGTEENGYMFILDPQSGETVVWNAGRQSPLPGRTFEGDITDFVVWEEAGQLVILACHAQPAEIYRYEVPIPPRGLPRITPNDGIRVYENPDWIRVMAIERGKSASGRDVIFAGAIGWGELIRSDDGGFSWTPVDYFNGINGADGEQYRKQLTRSAGFTDIYFVNNTWILFPKNSFLLESGTTEKGRFRHYVNGILLSQDGGSTWDIARVQEHASLPADLLKAIDADRRTNRLHPNLYGLVGERPHSLAVLEDGRLLTTTSINNMPEPPLGGRVLISADGGYTWTEIYHFTESRNIAIAALQNDILLVGTSTKTFEPPLEGVAVGEIWISLNQGNSFTPSKRVVASEKPSSHRSEALGENLWVVGVLAIAATDNIVAFGTVNEGEHAELFTMAFQKKQEIPLSASSKIEDNQLLLKVVAPDTGDIRGYQIFVSTPPELELVEGESIIKGTEIPPSGVLQRLRFRIWESGNLQFRLAVKWSNVDGLENISEVIGGEMTVVASPSVDVNKDYRVDLMDLVILGRNFNATVPANRRPNPDVNGDGIVNIIDLVAVATHFGEQYSALPLNVPAVVQ